MSDLANNKNKKKTLNTRTIVSCGMLAGCAIILTYLEFRTPVAPDFYRFNISDLPALIGAFALGPVAGVIIELIKGLVMLLINPANPTMGIGELSNFILGCAFVVPASIIYRKKKTKLRAAVGLIISGLFMAILGAFLNAFILIPMYAGAFFNGSVETIITSVKIFPFIDSLFEFCLVCVLPFNIIKALVVSAITMFIYKPLSMLIKGISNY